MKKYSPDFSLGSLLLDNLKDEIIKITKKWLDLPHYKVFYFGSRATGEASERSDIDIGIEAPQKIPGHLMTQMRFDLDDLPIMQKTDLVDFKTVSKDFKEIALRKIEVIYEK